jgi:hypothetical protein
MILLFGQHPQRAMADRQIVLHGRVGTVADEAPAFPKPFSSGGGGGGFGFSGVMRRQGILLTPPNLDEDLILALVAFMLLETENQS